MHEPYSKEYTLQTCFICIMYRMQLVLAVMLTFIAVCFEKAVYLGSCMTPYTQSAQYFYHLNPVGEQSTSLVVMMHLTLAVLLLRWHVQKDFKLFWVGDQSVKWMSVHCGSVCGLATRLVEWHMLIGFAQRNQVNAHPVLSEMSNAVCHLLMTHHSSQRWCVGWISHNCCASHSC